MIKILLKKAPPGARENGTSLTQVSSPNGSRTSIYREENEIGISGEDEDDFEEQLGREDVAKFQSEECGRCPAQEESEMERWWNKSVWKFSPTRKKRFASSPFEIASININSNGNFIRLKGLTSSSSPASAEIQLKTEFSKNFCHVLQRRVWAAF